MGESTIAGGRPMGATALEARALAPDLARGALLLLIALANAPLYLYGEGGYGDGMWVRGYPALDQGVVLLQTILVRGRAYPMFTLLFGYGIVQLLRRQTSRGVDELTARKLIRRRGWWMVLFGFLHALLLFSGDIVGAYGILAVLLAWVLLQAGDRMLLIMAALWTVPIVMFHTLDGQLTVSIDNSRSTVEPLHAAGLRVLEWVHGSIIGSIFSLVPGVLLGAWAARRRLLDEPAGNRPFLLRTAVLGLGLAIVGGLPWALLRASWWQPSSAAVAEFASTAHLLTGYGGGIGYAAVAGLVAIHLQSRDRPGPMAAALVACGQRSLTCYLLQSVVFVAVLAAYGGGLGNRLGMVEIAVLATATWALTVLLAEFMARQGNRGPAEALLRHLTYGRP